MATIETAQHGPWSVIGEEGSEELTAIGVEELAALRTENARLSNLVGRLLSEVNGYKPYARRSRYSPGWVCNYCLYKWGYDGPEHHAADCPVLEGRAEMAGEG